VTHSWQAPRLGADERILRVGAIGCGAQATTAIWPELPGAGFALEAVCSRTIEHARNAAGRFGVTRVFDDAARMLDEVELDALVVVVPEDAFAPYIRLAVERRLPGFVEKPAATSPAEAEELASLATAAGVDIVVGYQKRFAGAYKRAKALVADDAFGRPTLASFKWAMGPFLRRFDLRGWLFENPVHHFDLARFFLGELSDLRVLKTEAAGEFSVVVAGVSDSGAIFSVCANTTASWEQQNEAVEIFGEGSSVAVENVDTCIFRPAEGPEETWRPNYTVPAYRNLSGETLGFGAELLHFRSVVRGEARPESDLENAAATLRLADEIANLAAGRNQR
jgi:predicted dehydrogenase